MEEEEEEEEVEEEEEEVRDDRFYVQLTISSCFHEVSMANIY